MKWLATLDSRTRDSHADLNGQEVDADQTLGSPWTVMEIDYPGDPTAPPESASSCRCTLTCVYPKYNAGAGQRRVPEEDRIGEYQTCRE